MNRRNFLGLLAGGLAAGAAVRSFPFRVFSFPKEIHTGNWEGLKIDPYITGFLVPSFGGFEVGEQIAVYGVEGGLAGIARITRIDRKPNVIYFASQEPLAPPSMLARISSVRTHPHIAA